MTYSTTFPTAPLMRTSPGYAIFGLLSNLSASGVGVERTGSPITLSLDLNAFSFGAQPNEDIDLQFFFEGLGADVAGSEFNTPVKPFANQALIPAGGGAKVTALTDTVNAAATPIPPGIYRVAAMVKTKVLGSATVVMSGFIEGLVIEITP